MVTHEKLGPCSGLGHGESAEEKSSPREGLRKAKLMRVQ